MKKPRLSASAKVDRLLLHANYTSLCDGFGFGGVTGAKYVGRDADLTAAIAAWRARRLAEIEAQLHELGIADIDALERNLEQIREQYRKQYLEAIEAALAGAAPGPVLEMPKAIEPRMWIF
jgi:hypothetical protein